MIILRREGELCVMCMAYLIVLLEQLLRHQWRLIVVFSKCESSTSVGAAEVSTYKKKHPDEGIKEMCDCCTSYTARLP